MMPTPSPLLDNRSFQDLQRRLRELAADQLALSTWTPPPQGDAGTMLQHAFARLLEITLERLNRAPEKNRLAFLDAMGIDLLAPSAARVPLTFGLTTGASTTRVPKGSRVASEPSGGQPASTFETEADLTVIPAHITSGFTIDPTWDRYHDQTAALSGPQPTGFTPLVGTEALPHVLYLGDATMLNIVNAVIDVDFQWETEALSLEVLWGFLETLRWSISHHGQPMPLFPLPSYTTLVEGGEQSLVTDATTSFRAGDTLRLSEGPNTDTAVIHDVQPFGIHSQIRLTSPLHNGYSEGTRVERVTPILRFANVGAIDASVIQGVSDAVDIQAGYPGRWLQAALTTPFPDTPIAHDLRLHDLKLKVIASGQLPDIAFTNTAPVDVTKDFRPFGDIPQVGNAFYLGHEETFAKTGAEVTLNVQAGALAPRQLVWEYFNTQTDDWEKLQISNDETDNLMRSGRMTGVARHMGTTTVNGILGHWVRARLAADYRMAPKIKTFLITPAPSEGIQEGEFPPPTPPIRLYTNEDRINPPVNFFPLGKTPSDNDIFYFREPNGGFPMFPPQDNTFGLIFIDIELDEDRSDAIPPANLHWEYLGAVGWAEIPNVTDTTEALLTTGKVTFTLPETVRREVNGQEHSWIRARLGDTGYGREAEFVPVSLIDAAKGFQLRSGTGTVLSPLVQSLRIDYTIARAPTVLTRNGFFYHDRTADNATAVVLIPFISVRNLQPTHQAEPSPAMYLGLDATFPEQPMSLYLAVVPRAVSGRVIKDNEADSNPSTELTPLQWEYFNGTRWQELAMIDGTNDGTESGPLTFLTPVDIASLARFDLTPRYWIRARSATNDPADTQRWLGVFLNTVPALQAETLSEEVLGSSSGLPNQRFQLSRTPVLSEQEIWVREPEPPSQAERAVIEAAEGPNAVQTHSDDQDISETWVRWHQTPNFLGANPQSRSYTIDRASGRIAFGDGQRGLIPPRGTDSIRATYRTGGGTAGNVGPGSISKVQSTIPGVATVTNPVAAAGGAALETVDMVAERGPQVLRHRQRAVTSSDIEWLARQAAGTSVARAKCLPNINRDLRFEPGWVSLIIVPQKPQAKKPSPSAELIRIVEDYLEPRTFMGLTQQAPAHINVIGPGYVQVSVNADIVPRRIADAQAVKQRVLTALDAFFHPLTGGPQQSGWPFGRDVYDSELYQLLEGLDGVNYVKNLELIPNAAQHRLTYNLSSASTQDLQGDLVETQGLPAESLVQTTDYRKMAVLAAPLAAGLAAANAAGRITGAVDPETADIKGFNEGDRITRVHDATVSQQPDPAAAPTQIEIELPGPLDMHYPRGSVLMTRDGRMYTHLQAGLQPIDESSPIVTISVEDTAFVNNLQVGDALTVFYPFPMTITSIHLGAEPDTQVLSIEPYALDVPLPTGGLIATLDNRVRLPLHIEVATPSTVTALTLESWKSGDEVTLARRDRAYQLSGITIQGVEPAGEIVYIDDNFLVYPGVHRIHLVSE